MRFLPFFALIILENILQKYIYFCIVKLKKQIRE